MPEWELGICIPKFLGPISQSRERLFFEETIPIKSKSINDILYHVTYGILASILEDNSDVFDAACSKIQDSEWKRKERGLHGEKLKELEHKLVYFGSNSVGMTSMGPSLFFTSKKLTEVIYNMKKQYGDRIEIHRVKPFNKGRILSCLS